MQQSKVFLLCFTIAAVFLLQHASAKCNVCESNSVACINETSFRLCHDQTIDNRYIFHCPDANVCTDLRVICVAEGPSVKPHCDLTSGCSVCNNQKLFTCVSRTQYALCNGDVVTDDVATCPTGWVCSSSTPEICVPESSVQGEVECQRNAV
ncbi:uncharacterized protein LOC119680028 [Teleopsis dalmanni]|uniref:uncharacterized protein LOC119673537 n=1 Tax=Teleopsis dalmanni TaxID=139649 RepID=UPI0018CDC318|nr:uncharacterized protein LOC119673537 [Teleopsis dalmanni]XP_037941155.1 uncharacterized protein LOC119674099 [Teleopsis dalmanni]XP_037943399.1 uncharacterized protein LOC119673233 [Teleopsis dalmanni]XP_037948615.1 uncharacterized protein LOC119680028 [Teleopsis dalmanni]